MALGLNVLKYWMGPTQNLERFLKTMDPGPIHHTSI
jgi:hypothetical protein